MNKHLEDLGYQFQELSDSVWIIYNFFDKEDFDPIWKLVENSSEESWETAYRSSQELLALTKFNRTDVDNLISEGVMEYTYDWHNKNLHMSEEVASGVNRKLQKLFEIYSDKLHISNFEGIQRQYSGVELKEHIDGDAHPQIEYAAIGYMNDDYNGGDVFFSHLGLSAKPPKYSLLLFISSERHIHGVKEVLDGPTRYVLPTFIYHYIDQ